MLPGATKHTLPVKSDCVPKPSTLLDQAVLDSTVPRSLSQSLAKNLLAATFSLNPGKAPG